MIGLLLKFRNYLIRKLPDMPPWFAHIVEKFLKWGNRVGRVWALRLGGYQSRLKTALETLGKKRTLYLSFGKIGHALFSFARYGKRLVSDSMAGAADRIADFALRRAVKNGPAKSKRRLEAGRGRTIWGVTPILTLPLKARADRLLGFRSHSLVFVTYYISQNFDFNLRLLVNGVSKYAPMFYRALDRLVLAWAISRYDVFHLFYDRGLMRPVTRFGVNPEELRLLRAAGKRVYLYAYGADVRRRNATLALGKWNFCSDCPEPMKFCICDDKSGASIMAGMCENVTQAVAQGDMLTYVPGGRNVHYWPIDLERLGNSASSPARISGPLKIAHAPNHSHFKGTRYFENVLDKLRGAGHEIELIKVAGVPNDEVIRLFRGVDIVADQFIGGSYGYTALEAMAVGKPVLTYVRSADLVAAADECPLINCTPDNLEDVLLWVMRNRECLPAIGVQGKRYVAAWHSVPAVAERLGHMYEETGDFPEATIKGILEQRKRQQRYRENLEVNGKWKHPYMVS